MQPTHDSQPVLERCFAWLEKILEERKNSDGRIAQFSRNFRKGLTIVTVAYFVFLVITLFALGWWGERNWLLSILLFVPGVLWLVPFLLLSPFHLIFRPALCGITLAATLLICFIYLDFCWSFSTDKNEAGLAVVTANIGERKFRTLTAFLEREKPDVIALQDAGQRGHSLSIQYPDRSVATLDEYVLVSRFPIQDSGLLSELRYGSRSIGAWYELEYDGQALVIYNIHMPTPRPEFIKLRGRGFLAEAIGGGGIYSKETRKSCAEFFEARIRLARGLMELLRREKRPFLVVGDFNMPANGYIWDLFHSQLTDAFGAKGRGYGFTFPSTAGNFLSLFGPWLRLDYLFAGNNSHPVSCRVEPRQPGQHRAVVAQFEITKPQ